MTSRFLCQRSAAALSPGAFVRAALVGCLLATNAHAVRLLEPPLAPASGSAGDAIANEGHSLSATGRFMVFSSYATNLVAGDSNGFRDVFLWDVQEDRIELVSRSNSLEQANGDSVDAVISADGEWVAFTSAASNLAPDTNGAVEDVFLYQRRTGEIALVSRSTSGQQSLTSAANPDISANGRYVTFDTTGDLASGAGDTVNNVFRRDLWSGETELISKTPAGLAGNGMSLDAQMSASGERVVFVSMASDLVTTSTVGKESYLFDAPSNRMTLLSLTAQGVAGNGISYFPSLSGDGRFAAFHTNASNLVAGDGPNVTDVVLRDLTTGAFELLSRSTLNSPANNHNTHPTLSYRGDRVAFRTDASNLFPDDVGAQGDIVLRDRTLNTTTLVSARSTGGAGNGNSWAPSLTLDGSAVGFWSQASDLGVNSTAFGDALIARLDEEPTAPGPLAAAVLPSSRSAEVGSAVTAFATLVSADVATNCSIEIGAGGSVAVDFQTTNPATNAVVGAVNVPFLVLPDVPQSLLLTLRPTAVLDAQEIEFDFRCDQGVPPTIDGLNTLLLSASVDRGPDVVALAATTGNDGVVVLSSNEGVGAFAVASVNVGAGGTFTVRASDVGASLDALTVCATQASTGACLAAPAATVTTGIAEGATPTFGVFVSNADEVPFQPAENRVVVEFVDGSGVVRGRTSVAVRTEN